MAMLLVPLYVLVSICFNPSTPVLGVIKVEGGTQRNFMDHVSKHVSLTVCGVCYLTGCTEYAIRHCRNLHSQKTLHVPATYLGRPVVHPDLLETFITFSRGQGMTDELEAAVRKAFANKNILVPPELWLMIG